MGQYPHYLSPGPSQLPRDVKKQIHDELIDTFGIGVSVMEVSHRSSEFTALSEETLALINRVLGVPDTHALLLTPMGAQHHFSLLISHLSAPGETISYVRSGVWSNLAIADAKHSGRNLELIFDGEDSNFSTLGDPENYQVAKGSKYLHLTVNNTVYGTQYQKIPTHLEVPLLLDMTSSLSARTDIPWPQTGVVYASAQKNFGISGLSVVIIRKDLLEESKAYCRRNHLGAALSYSSVFEKRSVLNTPPVFPIYVTNRYFKWIEAQGGVAEMEARARANAREIYQEIDGEFYKGNAQPEFRSQHNFVFHLKNEELVEALIAEAAQRNILEVKGYRSVGGIRASLYNGVDRSAAKEFADLLREFRSTHSG